MTYLLETLYQCFIINIKYTFLCIFTVAFVIEVLYYLKFYLRVTFHKQYPKSNLTTNSSVIICARDEETNLKKNLLSVIEQNYKNLDIFVVLDACVDSSVDYIKSLSEKYPNLRYTVIQKDSKFTHGKKLALTIGIKGAKHDYMLMTDADCIPVSPVWAARMMEHFSDTIQIVLGYGKYRPEKTLLNKIIRYDVFFTAQQYLGMALAGFAYMGTGRNLAYTRSIYDSQRGFSKHSHIESGDDDLLVNSSATSTNCGVEISPESHTISDAPKTFYRWFLQKRRHLKSSKKYKLKHKFLLIIEPVARYIVWFFPIVLIKYPEFVIITLTMAALRFIIFMTVIKLNMIKLRENNFLLLAPINDILLPIFTIFAVLFNKLYKNKLPWK